MPRKSAQAALSSANTAQRKRPEFTVLHAEGRISWLVLSCAASKSDFSWVMSVRQSFKHVAEEVSSWTGTSTRPSARPCMRIWGAMQPSRRLEAPAVHMGLQGRGCRSLAIGHARACQTQLFQTSFDPTLEHPRRRSTSVRIRASSVSLSICSIVRRGGILLPRAALGVSAKQPCSREARDCAGKTKTGKAVFLREITDNTLGGQPTTRAGLPTPLLLLLEWESGADLNFYAVRLKSSKQHDGRGERRG